jgi:hypothetical protein
LAGADGTGTEGTYGGEFVLEELRRNERVLSENFERRKRRR